MASVDVLVVGYARDIDGGWEANSTATLISDGRRRILADPGLDAEVLQRGLRRRGLATGEITDVFLTHYHLDHLLNVGLFPHARISCGQYTLHGARGLSHHGAPYGPDLEVLPTPGHTPDHASLLVSTPEGLVAVAGDVIWYPAESLEEACSLPDPYAHDRRLLQESRMLLWKKAAVIVPGHGPAFSP